MCSTDAEYLAADAEDRRAALEAATAMAVATRERAPWPWGEEWTTTQWIGFANDAYRWLRSRPSLIPASIVIIPGTPTSEENPVTTSVDINDTQEIPFTLGGLDAKGAAVPAPTDTWAWTLNDPDQSGATLDVSTDTLSATVLAGTPTPNLSLSVVGQTTGMTGAESIIVAAGPLATVALVPGTPSTEPSA